MRGDDVSTEIVLGAFLGIPDELFPDHLGTEEVDAH
jgi:hypothetical protein